MQLPPLAPMRAFEVAARHLSFTKAADELHLTQGAISQQIKQLEQYLGFALFVRLPRRLELTEEGNQLAHVVRAALTDIGSTIDRLRAFQNKGALTVSLIASYATNWLMPRLPKFHALHPDIDLRLHTDDRLANLRTDGVDVALRYGWGSYRGMDTRLLLRERIFPVCSPKVMNGPNPIRKVEDLAHAILLHDIDWRNDETGNGWPYFLKQFGVERADVTSGPGFNQSSLMVQAAIHGQGVALARSAIAELELDTGRLVRPLDIWLDSKMALYFVCLPERSEEPKIAAFRDWLMAECEIAAKRYGTL